MTVPRGRSLVGPIGPCESRRGRGVSRIGFFGVDSAAEDGAASGVGTAMAGGTTATPTPRQRSNARPASTPSSHAAPHSRHTARLPSTPT